MENFKVGDIVARRSYNYDVLFRIIGKRGEMVDLVGITVRIIADAPEYDLKHISKSEIESHIKNEEKTRMARMNRCYYRFKNNNCNKGFYNIREPNIMDTPNIYKKESVLKKPGVILHIDGDSHLSNLKKLSNINTSEQVIFNHI